MESKVELVQALRRAAQQHPNSTATIDGPRRRTWQDVFERIGRLAGALSRHGIEHGDRVAILALNSDAYYETLYALFTLGAVAVPLNTRLAAPELQFQVNDAGVKALIFDLANSENAQLLRQAGPSLFFGLGHEDGVLSSLEGLIADSPGIPEPACSESDLAGIFYTGGTTGAPKGVMLSHRNFHAMATGLIMDLKLDDECVVLHSAPMFHLADFATFIVTMVGGVHVFAEKLHAEAMLDLIETHRVTHSFTVPAVIDQIARAPDLASRDLSCLKVLGYGGAAMTQGGFERARKAFPDLQFVQGFGMTEMPAVTFLGERHHRKGADPKRLRSAGRPGYGYEIRIVDSHDLEVPRGTVGEIVGRGDNVMQGYWRRPEETRQALRNGWMHSGDAGYMDEDGFIYITDRFKDMIVTGAENVYSLEVENVLSQHPSVLECAVIGVPDETWGERVHAIVVLQPRTSLSLEEMRAFVRERIAGYKTPKSLEVRQSPLPRSGAGKILKTSLRQQLQSEPQQPG
ncbi:MAG: long-chain fatty acid--CoA ligase [Hyphomonas sp.]|nr:long-chain fatty acid--CoA ligase [Hyphomonas sp.]